MYLLAIIGCRLWKTVYSVPLLIITNIGNTERKEPFWEEKTEFDSNSELCWHDDEVPRPRQQLPNKPLSRLMWRKRKAILYGHWTYFSLNRKVFFWSYFSNFLFLFSMLIVSFSI